MMIPLLSKAWLPYTLLAGVVAVGSVSWWIHNNAYHKGYGVAEAVYTAQLAEALERRLSLERKIAESDLQAVVVTANRKQEVRYAVTEIVRTVDSCDTDDWLRVYNEGVRAAATEANTREFTD